MAKITEAGPSHTPGEEPEGWGQRPDGEAELEEDEGTGDEEPDAEGDISPGGGTNGGSGDSANQDDESPLGGTAGTAKSRWPAKSESPGTGL